MRLRPLLLPLPLAGLLLAVSPGSSCAQVGGIEASEEAWRTGRYEEAQKGFRALIEGGSEDVRAYRGLTGVLAETGRYAEAVAELDAFRKQHPRSVELSNARGEVLMRVGRWDEARAAFEEAVRGGASDALTAKLNLAILDHRRGEREEALRQFDGFIDVYNRSPALDSRELTAIATACTYLAVNNPQLLKDALRAYDEAVAADPLNLKPLLLVGELFLRAYNSPDARESFKAVLAVNPNQPRALLGMARVLDFDGSGAEALELVEKALSVNPNLIEGHIALAEHQLELEDYAKAIEEAERALSVNPSSLEALSILAAAHFLNGERAAFEQVKARVFATNPRYAEFYNTVAEVCVQNRLYREAVELAREAVGLDETSWRAYGLLGLNQLRLGAIEEGKENLERAFAGDPYNVWNKNTLDLVDTFSEYRKSESERFVAVVHGKESELLAPYVTAVAEEAYQRLADRYEYMPETPIRIEVYPSHADFSVRTIGLAGLGALGVCFGPVVAIDSPSAREKGEFNWASTLWHELAHTVTLGITDHRVPRWFSEGLSVYEERNARPGWGDDVNLPFLNAYRQRKLLPIGELNNGFIRPSYPQQIGISYYQASLVCEMIDRDHGFQAIRSMLAGYRRGLGTEEVFEEVLGVGLEAFDESFESYLQERFGETLEVLRMRDDDAPARALEQDELQKRVERDADDFLAHLALGQLSFREAKLDEALPLLERARDLFPEYGGNDSPYWYLGQIYRKKGEPAKAEEALSRLTAINENHYEAHLALGEVREKLGDREGAVEILERALYIYPFEAPVHERLANLYRDLGMHGKVVRERQALVGLGPVDRAQALYDLAVAYHEAGDPASARREVLRALEIAPGFDKALDLLLTLRAEASEVSG